MIPTTQNWKDKYTDRSDYQPYIVVFKNGNIIWTFDSEHIRESSLRFTDDICDLGEWNVGATPSNTFECDIINFDGTFPAPSVLKGCKCKLYFITSELEFGGTTAVAGQATAGTAIVGTDSTDWDEYIPRGTYYLDPINSVGRTVHISGSDAMSLEKFNSSNMEGYNFNGKTCMQVIQEMGFNLQNTFPNYDYVLPNVQCTEEFNLDTVTKRTVLGYIASICGCYARHDNHGVLQLKGLNSNSVYVGGDDIMPYPYSSIDGTYQGVTFSTEKGTLTINGTATASVAFRLGGWTIAQGSIELDPDRTYFLCGTPEGGGTNTYNLNCRAYVDGVTPGSLTGVLLRDTGNGIVLKGYKYVSPAFTVRSGATATNLVVYPRLYEVGLDKIMEEPDTDYYPVEITGAFVSGTNGAYSVQGTDGYYISSENNPLITSNAEANTIASYLYTMYNGVEMTPFNMTLIADPSMEAGDTIEYTHNGKTTTTIVSSMQYALGQFSNISSDADTDAHSSKDALIAEVPQTLQAVQKLYNGDTLKKIINLSASEVQIDANNLNINGVVSANNTFKILEDGSVEIKNGGDIGGFHIGNTSLYNGMVSLDSTSDGVYLGSDGVAVNGGTVRLGADGNCHMGGWNIGENPIEVMSLYSDPYETEISGCMARTVFSTEVKDVTAISEGISVTYPASSIAVDVQQVDGNGNPTYYARIYYVDENGHTHTDISYADTFSQTSDRRKKKDIEYLNKEKCSEFIYKLKPSQFRYDKPNASLSHGFIAQDVEKLIDDEWAVVREDRGVKSLVYTEIIADLVATVQTLNERIKMLEEQINGTN